MPRLPPHLLAPHTISNISAEALVALEAGLTSKVQDRQLTFGEAWEDSLRIGGRMVGETVKDDIETVWANLSVAVMLRKLTAQLNSGRSACRCRTCLNGSGSRRKRSTG